MIRRTYKYIYTYIYHYVNLCFSSCVLVSLNVFRQLPHMPHINECLMKRNLKPTDLRDMTLGQLQVIVNDLHSQIESKLTTQ